MNTIISRAYSAAKAFWQGEFDQSCEQVVIKKTSQELQMLSTVAIDCQITKIVMDSGSQLSELLSVSQMSQVLVLARIAKLP